MRRFLAAVLLVLLVASPVAAASFVRTGTASWGHPVEFRFVTTTVGTVSAEAVWNPKPQGGYSMYLFHLTDPGDVSSYDQWCTYYTGYNNPPPPGDWLCSIPNGNPGTWFVRFAPFSGGKTFVTIWIGTPF